MNTSIDATRLLQMMRTMAAESGQRPELFAPATQKSPASDFSQVLKSSLGEVNRMQQGAESLATAFEQGQAGLDVTRVMLESQKAAISFRAMTEVRNRLVSAYQDVMNMPI
jgi:flagellar hook-basal body complex protein FliE